VHLLERQLLRSNIVVCRIESGSGRRWAQKRVAQI
jgi:hypothetical protein